MRTKNEIQAEIIDTIVENDFQGIVLSSVRTGKTRILLTSVIQHMEKNYFGVPFHEKHVLVLYPNIDIKNSWLNECEIIGCPTKITYCTFASMYKLIDEEFDYIVCDEAHLLGEENQLPLMERFLEKNKHVILASGTYSGNTLAAIKNVTNLNLIVNYSTEDAIKDGIVSDFKVIIHKYKLDDKVSYTYGKVKKWNNTELREASRLTRAVNHANGKTKMFYAIQRMHFINGTNSLISSVKNWIKENTNQRFLLFAGSEKMGKNFNLPMFNSKSETSFNLEAFISGDINQLCLIKKGSAGVTYPNLQKIVITGVNSNGENLEQMLGRALLTDTEDAEIHIFVSDQDFQINWLNVALCRVNKDKISYLYED
jgi:superfamily II DNA or RNA helicase